MAVAGSDANGSFAGQLVAGGGRIIAVYAWCQCSRAGFREHQVQRASGPTIQGGLEFGTVDFASTERVQVIGG